jgi:hypothetical protein
MASSKEEILKKAEGILAVAKLGLDNFIKGPKQNRFAGLMNVVVFGRAVTNVLQNLRSICPDYFDHWYQKYKEEMAADELLKYFYDLRSKILKEGEMPVSVCVKIERLEFPQDLSKLGSPPPYAVGSFIGDNFGGSGWLIQLPDGSTESYYVELPQDIGSVSMYFPNPPRTHLGKEIGNDSIENISRLYIDYLSSLVESAKKCL